MILLLRPHRWERAVDTMRNQISLNTRFSILVALIILLSIVAWFVWNSAREQQAVEDRVLAEARVLRMEMNAIWDYVNENQDRINYNSDGIYDFKGLYCTVAGKNIAQRFMRETDYIIRFVRERPRSSTDLPDAFETSALRRFENGDVSEYYEMGLYEGKSVFRYASALRIKGSCLSCHGGKVGDKDETEFLKEGMMLGDLGGAISVVVPLDSYEKTVREDAVANIIFFALLMVIIVSIIQVALRHWITGPLQKLGAATNTVGQGDFSIDLDDIHAKGEIKTLSDDFLRMANQLKEAYATLEEKVEQRTLSLEQANHDLDEQRRQIEQVNESLETANAKLREEGNFKTTILAIMSHELRTPLTAILAVIDVWEKSLINEQPEDRKLINDVRSNCTSLLAMIENTIDMARLDAGRFNVTYTDVDLVDVINTVENLVQPLAARKRIELTSDVDTSIPIIKGDWEVFRKILMNLVGNALKFTGESGRVHVSAQLSPDDSQTDGKNYLEIKVADNGIGISETDQEMIFSRFVQSDSSISRKYQGSGLGLSLVNELVELLGGSTVLKSEAGKGSEFSVILPFESALDDETESEKQEDQSRP
jgi:signal transduction histidine kinase